MTEKSKTKRNHVIWSREEYLRQKAASTEKMGFILRITMRFTESSSVRRW